MSEETKVLIDKPGKYLTRCGEVATVNEIWLQQLYTYPAKGFSPHHSMEWRLDGHTISADRPTGFDIIGQRIAEPDAQDRIAGVEGLPEKSIKQQVDEIAELLEHQRQRLAPTGMGAELPVKATINQRGEWRETPPTPMERYGAYVAKWPPARCELSQFFGGGYAATITRNNVDGSETECHVAVRAMGRGATPDLALAAAMDVLEGRA